MQNNSMRGNTLFNAYHKLKLLVAKSRCMDNCNSGVKDILDVDRGLATPQLSKEAIMGSLKIT